MSASLLPLPEDWERGLAVVAHPDDMEYGAASAVARWTSQGKTIDYVLATSGEAGISAMPPSEVAPLREAEQRASCREVGVRSVEFLGFPDGTLVADLGLRRALALAIREHRPEVIVSINFRDSWGGASWNHADHRALGGREPHEQRVVADADRRDVVVAAPDPEASAELMHRHPRAALDEPP